MMLRILLSVLLLAVPVNGFTASNTRTQESRSSRWTLSSTPTTTTDETPKIVNGDAAAAEIPNEKVVEQVELEDDVTIFEAVASRAASCLFESDKRRDAKGKASGTSAPSSATNWVDDATAFSLQRVFDRIKLKLAEERLGIDRDEASSWIRWMKSAPTPLIVDLSEDLRTVANMTLTDKDTEMIETSREEFLSRLGCRLILLPSGASLQSPLREPPASIIYGKLLYGGVTRFRLLSSSQSKRPPRKAGERTDVKSAVNDNIPAWIQYGGTERMYEALDMGAAAVFEIFLLQRGQAWGSQMSYDGDMVVKNIVWKPKQMLDYVREKSDEDGATDNLDYVSGYTPISQYGKERNQAFESDFRTSVGGLQPQIDAIVRRVLDGRVIRPAQEDDNAVEDETTTALSIAAMEAEELAILGLTPVRGLLLYGPPGCGKTALAREISRSLRARAPKIVSAPELLDRWVGGSEKLVRGLFADAEAELASCNGDATKSALHVIVIDEIDAVFRRRSSAEDTGEATRASVVNQILSKLDGINSIPNVLLIGMTNRRELLDEALLRPGRLEVQIDIPLPDKEGRREILQIHFDALRKNGRLSKPLCCAIDGVFNSFSSDETLFESASDSNIESSRVVPTKGRKRRAIKRVLSQALSDAKSIVHPTYDLAADSSTSGFSGADIAGLVRCAGSLALARARKVGNGVDDLLITMEDVKQALQEVRK